MVETLFVKDLNDVLWKDEIHDDTQAMVHNTREETGQLKSNECMEDIVECTSPWVGGAKIVECTSP